MLEKTMIRMTPKMITAVPLISEVVTAGIRHYQLQLVHSIYEEEFTSTDKPVGEEKVENEG